MKQRIWKCPFVPLNDDNIETLVRESQRILYFEKKKKKWPPCVRRCARAPHASKSSAHGYACALQVNQSRLAGE